MPEKSTNNSTAETVTLENRMSFTLKDMVYIVAIIVSVLGNYYATDTRLILLERDISDIKAQQKGYEGLPGKVQIIDKKVEKNAKITRAIYLGLVAKGIIQPDPNL